MKFYTKEDFDKLARYSKEHGRDKLIIDVEKNIIERGVASEIIDFARLIDCADVKKMQKALVLATKNYNNPKLLYEFARYVKGADIKNIVDELVSLKKCEAIILVGRYVKLQDAERNKLTGFIVKNGHGIDICEYARYTKNVDLDILADAVIKRAYEDSKEGHYVYLFARDVKGANIKKLQDAIIKIGVPAYILWFARDVVSADVKVLREAMLKTGDRLHIDLFKQEFKLVEKTTKVVAAKKKNADLSA